MKYSNFNCESTSDIAARSHDKKASDEIKQQIKDFGEESVKRYDEFGVLIK